MLGFDAIGSQPIASGRIRTLRALMAQMFGGSYTLSGKALSFVHFVATVQRLKIRVAKPVLYQVRQFLGVLGR